MYSGGCIIEHCSKQRALAIAKSPNVDLVWRRKTKQIVQVNIAPMSYSQELYRDPDVSLSQYLGQRYTYHESLQNEAGEISARTITFKRIDPQDAPLFRLSVTDCLSNRTCR